MRVATWNVNSIRTRINRVVDFCVSEDIDVLAMQEIKCKPEQFPREPFEQAGYHLAIHGLNQWNGVAFASKYPMENIQHSFPGMPGFLKGFDGPNPPQEARALGVNIAEAELWSLYVPNGRALDDPHYHYKLTWFNTLRDYLRARVSRDPQAKIMLMGDFNVAPHDSDNGDPSMIPGVSTHISAPERAAFEGLLDAGMSDLVRPIIPHGYTYWDYKQLRFPRDEGLRIDFILGSRSVSETVIDAHIYREQRKGEQPSDHVPVLVEYGTDNNGDDRAMVF